MKKRTPAGKKAPANRINAVIAQSGGPTAVINASLAGAAIAFRSPQARKRGFCKLYGARNGIDGILRDDFIDLSAVGDGKLRRVAATPSAALGSSRRKPSPEDCAAIVGRFKAMDIRVFFYIGGNDSADTARIVARAARDAGWPLVCVHIPKTIDNDLRSCDVSPGYASAARFVALAVNGDDYDNRALGGVKIDVIMGRDAGFLTAAAALGRRRPDDGPHLVYLPEVPFSEEKFVEDVKKTYAKFGRCVVAVSEGIRGPDGVPVAAKLCANGEKDAHGNVQLSGSGALGDALARLVKEKTGVKRVRADTFGYIQRCFPGCVSDPDWRLAAEAAVAAVGAAGGALESGDANAAATIGIKIAPSAKNPFSYEILPIGKAARETRSLPKKFIARNGSDVTRAFIDYAAPLVGELPEGEVF